MRTGLSSHRVWRERNESGDRFRARQETRHLLPSIGTAETKMADNLPVVSAGAAVVAVFFAWLVIMSGDIDASVAGKEGGVKKMDMRGRQSDGHLKYCSFFNNRAPEVQRGLKNCTWFKESSCCRQEEIDATFGRVKPLRGASPDCQRYTNYLMCYICSPDQSLFYLMESLTVCEEFCNAWYDACRTAILKGSVIRDLYDNGRSFCASRRFKVDTVKNGRCFFFDARQDKNGASAAWTCGHVGFLLASVSVLYQAILSKFI